MLSAKGHAGEACSTRLHARRHQPHRDQRRSAPDARRVHLNWLHPRPDDAIWGVSRIKAKDPCTPLRAEQAADAKRLNRASPCATPSGPCSWGPGRSFPASTPCNTQTPGGRAHAEVEQVQEIAGVPVAGLRRSELPAARGGRVSTRRTRPPRRLWRRSTPRAGPAARTTGPRTPTAAPSRAALALSVQHLAGTARDELGHLAQVSTRSGSNR